MKPHGCNKLQRLQYLIAQLRATHQPSASLEPNASARSVRLRETDAHRLADALNAGYMALNPQASPMDALNVLWDEDRPQGSDPVTAVLVPADLWCVCTLHSHVTARIPHKHAALTELAL